MIFKACQGGLTMDKRAKITAEWKAIDKILGIRPSELSESRRRQYFALKSLLLKEAEYLRSACNVVDYTANMLTEDTHYNIKFLTEDVNDRLQELCNKNKKVAKAISEASIKDKNKLLEAKLEVLVAGDVLEHLAETKSTPNNLGFVISSEMLSGYVRSLVEFAQNH